MFTDDKVLINDDTFNHLHIIDDAGVKVLLTPYPLFRPIHSWEYSWKCMKQEGFEELMDSSPIGQVPEDSDLYQIFLRHFQKSYE